jgi:hypothetical protein
MERLKIDAIASSRLGMSGGNKSMSNHWRKFLLFVIAIVMSVSSVSCRKMCGCTESEADAITMAIVKGLDPRVTKATLDMDTHLIGDDKYKITMSIPNMAPIVSEGTFSQSGDTITFKVTNGVSALIMPGEYKLTCTERDRRKLIIVQKKGGPALTFVCH